MGTWRLKDSCSSRFPDSVFQNMLGTYKDDMGTGIFCE